MHKKIYNTLSFIFLLTACLFSQSVESKEKWKRVRLATFPRSGNHWVRFLIEEATHIVTGSVYPDPDYPHSREPFPWGGFATNNGYAGNCRYPKISDFVLIKTHFPVINNIVYDRLPFIKTIRIVRHPIDSIYSHYTYRRGPQPPDAKIPSVSVDKQIRIWLLFQLYWDQQPNVTTIRYEDLYEDPFTNLKLILKTIGYKVKDADIRRAIEKYPPAGGLMKYVNRYTDGDLNMIANRLKKQLLKYDYKIPVKSPKK